MLMDFFFFFFDKVINKIQNNLFCFLLFLSFNKKKKKELSELKLKNNHRHYYCLQTFH